MNNRFRVAVLALGFVVLSSPALAAAPPAPTADPTANTFSASAAIPSGGTSVLVAEIPEGQVFLLTQYCRASGGGFGPTLRASVFGIVPADGTCTSYTPGVLIRGGQSISCTVSMVNDFEETPCMITGYKVKR